MNALLEGLRHRKGFGIHSPFVYDLITKVIEERCSYYRLDDIELVRKQLKYREEAAPVVKRGLISPRQGSLLFRLTNYFKPETILEIGSSAGLSTLYISSYKPGLTCISLGEDPDCGAVARWVYGKGARTSVDLRIGACREQLPPALDELGSVDFIYLNAPDASSGNEWIFQACLKYIHPGTVFVIEGIRKNAGMRACWKEITAHPETTVCLDLFSTGIVFFNKKLYKRSYRVYY